MKIANSIIRAATKQKSGLPQRPTSVRYEAACTTIACLTASSLHRLLYDLLTTNKSYGILLLAVNRRFMSAGRSNIFQGTLELIVLKTLATVMHRVLTPAD